MPRVSDTAPPRLHHSDIIVLNKEDPILGVLTLETDDGAIELAINEQGARELAYELLRFLGEEEP